MKLQEASRKELTRIAWGVLICDAIMIAVLFVLSLFGVGSFSLMRILLGAAGGSAIAIGNFALLCLTVQNAASTEDQKLMKQKFQLSYNLRLVIQAAWIVASYLIPWIHFLAGALPTIFPNLVIYFLQITGRLMPASQTQQPAKKTEDEDEPEDRLETFEA